MPKLLISQNLLGYYPAELKQSDSGWRIVYYVENPANKAMQRKSIKVNRIKSITERKKHCRHLIKAINEKLAKGWNPYLEESAAKGYTTINDALRIFIQNKAKELRADSMRTYRSYCRILENYLNQKEKQVFTVSITQSEAQEFMHHIYMVKNVSNNTYNNYLLTYRVIFNWLVENQYAAINPFAKLKPKKKQAKIRRILSDTERDSLYRYYNHYNKRFLACIYLAFHGLLRPTEITFLKPIHIDFKKQLITPPHTKNGKPRIIAIPSYIINLLEELEIPKQDPSTFIFSSGFRAGHHKLCPRKISKEWDKARQMLGWGKDLTFYSLRDSGIVQMLKDGIRIEEVQKHADHASIETTQRYINLAFPEGVKAIKEKSSRF